MISYQDLAVRLGHPTACRAVAGAVAANPIGYLIPCHRVIRKSGEIHHYRWGHIRKKAMLGREALSFLRFYFAYGARLCQKMIPVSGERRRQRRRQRAGWRRWWG